MTARAVLRIRRSVEGLPPPTSDEDLIAWSQSLVQSAHRRREPLRAPSRGSALTDDEIFDEIRARVARPQR